VERESIEALGIVCGWLPLPSLVDEVAWGNVLLLTRVKVNHLHVPRLVIPLRTFTQNNVTPLVVLPTHLVLVRAVIAVVHHVFGVDGAGAAAVAVFMAGGARTLSFLVHLVRVAEDDLAGSLVIHHAGEVVAVVRHVNLFPVQLGLLTGPDVSPLLHAAAVMVELAFDWGGPRRWRGELVIVVEPEERLSFLVIFLLVLGFVMQVASIAWFVR